jgi:hypothetical protein
VAREGNKEVLIWVCNLGFFEVRRISRVQLGSDPPLRGVLYQEETKTLGSKEINDLHF